MAFNSSTSNNAPNWIIDELLSQGALAPLRGKRIMLNKLNYSDISGQGSDTRSVRSYSATTEADETVEGVEMTPRAIDFNANITSVPVEQGVAIAVTDKMLELVGRMPRSQVIAAIKSGDPAMLPLVKLILQEGYQAHLQKAERLALSLFSGATDSSGTTTQNLSFATLIDSHLKLTDNNTAHEDYVCVVDSVGVADLRNQALTATGTMFSDTSKLGFFDMNPDVDRSGFKGFYAGLAIFEADKTLMATANAAADRVGAVFCLGSGAADEGKRGFAEFCERSAPLIEYDYNPASSVMAAYMRWSWSVFEHTDAHIVKLIYGIT